MNYRRLSSSSKLKIGSWFFHRIHYPLDISFVELSIPNDKIQMENISNQKLPFFYRHVAIK